MKPNRSFRQEESGQSLVEFALISSVLLLLVFAAVDLARAMSVVTSLAAAGQAAARAGAVTATQNVIETTAKNKLMGIDVNAVAISVDQTSEYTQVTLSYDFRPITPFVSAAIGRQSIPLSNTSRIRVLGGGGGGVGAASAPIPTNTPSAFNPPSSIPASTSTPAPASTPMPGSVACTSNGNKAHIKKNCD